MAGLVEALADLVLARADRPGWVLGLSGAQGSGKSTLAAGLASALAQAGRSCAVLSLDDVYLGPEARRTWRGGSTPCSPCAARRGRMTPLWP